jgi:hypothetical protein
MTQWTFVIAAYVVVSISTLGLVAWSFQSMRRAEADADALRRK